MLLSIIIPCRDRQESLTRLIEQLTLQISQCQASVEVLVVDDGSSPNLVLDQFAVANHVTIHRLSASIGANPARAHGLSNARGKFVHFHDSDDLVGHDWLNRLCRRLSTDWIDVDVIITRRIVCDERNETLSLPSVKKLTRLATDPKYLAHSQYFVNSIGPLGGVTISKQIADQIAYHNISASQDWSMYDSVLRMTNSIVVDNTNYFIFIKHKGVRISNNSLRRARGYVSVAKHRFRTNKQQRLAARLYCCHGAEDLKPRIIVKHRILKRLICALFASTPIWRLFLEKT